MQFITVCRAQLPELSYPYGKYELTDKYRTDCRGKMRFDESELNFNPVGAGMPFINYRSVQVAIPLMVAGGVMFGNDVAFRDMRNDFLGSWRYHYDDYMQYSPGMVMLGLKAFGVEGRSSWGRLAVSGAFSAVGTVALANGTKALGLRTRPDGSNRRSFPSGHTATAFAAATMLHKEYGTTVSPWFSVGGYAVATATGMSRMLNNKHWMSDVLTGAGIGIFATELGYYVADKIFRERGLLRGTYERAVVDNYGCPSFVGVVNGVGFTSQAGRAFGFSGVRTGIEGAWFPSQWIGFGGQIDASGNRSAEFYSQYWLKNQGGEPVGDLTVYNMSFLAGMYGSLKVGARWLLMGKLFAGASAQRNAVLTATLDNGMNAGDNLTIGFSRKTHPTFGFGLSTTFVANNHLGIRLFADARSLTQESDPADSYGAGNYNKTLLFPITVGVSFDALLW